MNILNFIVINGSLRSTRDGSGSHKYAMNGEIFIPLETPVPIIQKGVGCVGLGMVRKISITKTSTIVYFTSTEISESSAKAYYDLYRNQITVDDTIDYSSQEDVVIPGLVRGVKPATNKSSYDSDYDRRRSNSHKSLMEYGDDNYHW